MALSSSGRLSHCCRSQPTRTEAKREGVKASEDATSAATAAHTLNMVLAAAGFVPHIWAANETADLHSGFLSDSPNERSDWAKHVMNRCECVLA